MIKLQSIAAFYTTATLYLPTTFLSDLNGKDFLAFFVERCDDHRGFFWPDKSLATQPRIHPSLVAVQYLQHNCA